MTSKEERAHWQRITDALRARIVNDPRRPKHISEVLPDVLQELEKKYEQAQRETIEIA